MSTLASVDPAVYAAISLLVLLILYRILTGTFNVFKVIEGADGRPSTSKLQFWAWTVVALVAYVMIFAARAEKGYLSAPDVPPNLLLAMGFSVITAVGAKAITTSQIKNGQLAKTSVGAAAAAASGPTTVAGATKPTAAAVTNLELAVQSTSGLGGLAKEDDGTIDLSKVQLLAWTVVAIGVYAISLFSVVAATKALAQDTVVDFGKLPAFPDISPALVVLMGLGQAAYLGRKLVTTDTPRISGLVPSSGSIDTQVKVLGASFGDNGVGSQVTLDGMPIAMNTTWSDNQITFCFPSKRPDTGNWKPGDTVQVGVIAGGIYSANSYPFTITA
jgi:hypothetical protein